MSKGRKPAQADPAEEAFWAGHALVLRHPLLGGLAGRATFVRDKRESVPRDAWLLVDANGHLRAHPTRRGSPAEWAYAIAHALLHLGFGHFSQRPPEAEGTPEAWNAACCAVIARFMATLKLGQVPEGLDALPEVSAGSEEGLYRQLREQGVPALATRWGTGITHMDMQFVSTRGYFSYSANWQALLADGLTRAVTAAVEAAAGVHATAATDGLTPKLRRARDWLIGSYPLLGGLAAGFTLIEDAALCGRMEITVAAVHPEAREIYLNPTAGLTDEELRFVLAHELLHAGLRHDVRREGRDSYLWNVACDYVINGWLVEMRLGAMPGIGLLYDPTLAGLSAEALYDRIVTDARVYRKLATFRGKGLGDLLEPRAGWWLRDEGLPLDEFYRRALAQGYALHHQAGRGLLPAGLVEEIRALDMRPIPWDVALARWFDEHFPLPEPRRSYARPSRRQGATPDIPLPRYVKPVERVEARTYGVLLDTSGSMDRALLARALGAIASYSLAREVSAARVIFCDAAPYDQGYLAPETILDRVQVRGRGGTVLQPGIDLLEHAKDFPKDGPLLIITDGECDKLVVKRSHAFLLPAGADLPFAPHGPVFRIEKPGR